MHELHQVRLPRILVLPRFSGSSQRTSYPRNTSTPLSQSYRRVYIINMAGKKVENDKKVQGNARKQAAKDRQNADKEAREEDARAGDWSKGTKSNAKKWVLAHLCHIL
jgi:Tfp pilus tip-associated adhesin PilY1